MALQQDDWLQSSFYDGTESDRITDCADYAYMESDDYEEADDIPSISQMGFV